MDSSRGQINLLLAISSAQYTWKRTCTHTHNTQNNCRRYNILWNIFRSIEMSIYCSIAHSPSQWRNGSRDTMGWLDNDFATIIVTRPPYAHTYTSQFVGYLQYAHISALFSISRYSKCLLQTRWNSNCSLHCHLKRFCIYHRYY